MAQYRIIGSKKLEGDIPISGAKNAALKLLPAALLASGQSVIHNVPNILDIQRMEHILSSIGAKVAKDGNTISIDSSTLSSTEPDPKLIRKLRGSIVLVGPLLARFGAAQFSEPGGCLIGSRPIDDHLDVFRQLGVSIHHDGEKYHFTGKPQAGTVILSKMSVTATENAIMATVLSPGTSRILAAAAEPEIADLAKFLNAMGARISGAGTHEVTIEGVDSLHPAEHFTVPDRIEIGTYLITALAANAEISIGPVLPDHLSVVLKKLWQAGGIFDIVENNGNTRIVTHKHNGLQSVSIDTRTYPGFPTDLQSPYAILMTQAQGKSRIFETLFEGRFLYLSEIQKMGACVEVLSPHIIDIIGPTQFKGKPIICQDIRGGVALIIAALIAQGETIIDQIELVDRGYESLEHKLSNIGAAIERIQ